MSLYAISDLHLSLGADKSMDIFAGWGNYVQKLERNWRDIVRGEDTVVLPGDISWAMKLEDTLADFTFLQGLPGRKILLKGNHDLWWNSRAKMDAFFAAHGLNSFMILHNDAVPACGIGVCGTRGWFAEETAQDRKLLLREAGRLNTSILAAKKTGLPPVVFLHYPPLCAGARCDELMDVLHAQGITRCYYGHIHGSAARRAVCGLREGIEFTLVSCDAIKFTPMPVTPAQASGIY